MTDYIEILEKLNDIKEITELIDEVRKLRHFYRTGQIQEMRQHIDSLTKKYFVDTVIWNTLSREMPTTYDQSYINAENFLQTQGVKLIAKNFNSYKNRFTPEEVILIESYIGLM